MAGYLDKLQDLVTLNRAGAVDPMSAIQQMYALQDQKKANRQARQSAMMEQSQGLYSDLTSMAMGAAEEGSSLDTLAPQLQAAQTFAGVGLPPQMQSQLEAGIESLYLPSGLSRSTPTLDAEDIAAIQSLASSATDRATALESVKATLLQAYGPNTVERLLPQAAEIVGKIKPY